MSLSDGLDGIAAIIVTNTALALGFGVGTSLLYSAYVNKGVSGIELSWIELS